MFYETCEFALCSKLTIMEKAACIDQTAGAIHLVPLFTSNPQQGPWRTSQRGAQGPCFAWSMAVGTCEFPPRAQGALSLLPWRAPCPCTTWPRSLFHKHLVSTRHSTRSRGKICNHAGWIWPSSSSLTTVVMFNQFPPLWSSVFSSVKEG
jgi:hypothetical protein